MKKITFPILILSLFISSAPCLADGQPSYGNHVGQKAINSLSNITTAFIEIPKNIINTTNNSNIAYGITGGLFKGAVNTVGRLLVGIVDLITIPIPTKPIAQPAYVWQKFDIDTSYGEIFHLENQEEI